MSTFTNLGLSPTTLKALDALGFTTPTQVQIKSIPLLIQNNPCDFIGLAQTGTGKTAAYGLPLIELIDSSLPTTQALVMSPTRELSQQTGKQLMDFSRGEDAINVEIVYGGVAIMNQIKALRRPTQIVVATPGRLLDLIKRKAIKLSNISHVVLDEADEMLNMGFKEAIDEILSYTPETKSTWLFSATMPAEIRKIISKYMKNPEEITINREEKSNKDITHQYVITKASNKLMAIRRFLDMNPDMRGVMFCRTRRETQQIADELNGLGYSSEPLHGELSQQQRDAAMKRFKSRSIQLLIATDVAARGIDVNELTHVINHTLPDQLESYTHRSGRTGRAGKKGISLVFINPREGKKIQELERKINVKFEQLEVPNVNSIQTRRLQNWADTITKTTIDEKSEKLYESIKHEFEELSKEEILQRIISEQLRTFIISEGESDLNESIQNSSSSNSSRSSNRKTNSKFNQYFINLGTIDGMNKTKISSYVTDIGQIDKQFVGEIMIKQNHSYFELDKKHDTGVAMRFKNIQFQGRDIRMNRESNVPNTRTKPQRKNRFEKKSSRKQRW